MLKYLPLLLLLSCTFALDLQVYKPLLPFGKYPAVIILQGANIDGEQYSMVAKKIAQYGVVVAVPDAPSIEIQPGFSMKAITPAIVLETKAKLFSDYGNLLNGDFILLGHSYGSVIATIMASNDAATVCSTYLAPLCAGYTGFGSGLKGVLGYGLSMIDQNNNHINTNTTGVPIASLQGELDSRTEWNNAIISYYTLVDSPKIMFKLEGHNHYGITNSQDQPIPDDNIQAVSQENSTSRIALLVNLFIQSNNNAAVKSLLYNTYCSPFSVFDSHP